MSTFFEPLESRKLFAATPVTLQAEAAVISGALVQSSNSGYSGSGYVDYQRSWGDWIEWTVNAPAAGTHRVNFRYANGSGDRPLELRVNGQVVRPQLSFPSTGSWRTWNNVGLDVALAAGANKLRLSTAGFNGPNVDSMTVTPPKLPPPPPPPTGTYEAELAARSGPGIGRSNGGFTGTGYADYGTTEGQWVEWTVNDTSAGQRTLTFRYANGSSDRPLELRVNGQVVNSRLSFPPTGSWGTWKTVTLSAPLIAGANKIRLTSLGAGPNVDSLTVTGQTEPPPPPPPTGVFEAEADTVARVGVGVGSGNAGFTGTGYADYSNATGDVIEWTMNVPTAGDRTITFRYANGSGDRPLELRVNGQVVQPRLVFTSTGSWRTWRTVSATVPFAAGPTRVRLSTIGFNGPNVDSLAVPGATVASPADWLKLAVDFSAEKLRRTAAEVPVDRYVNYTLGDGTWNIPPDPGWESGLLPGAMWQMYQRTGDPFWKDQATARTLPLEAERHRKWDVTPVLFKSFKPLYDLTGNPEYRQIMLDAAAAKASWFHERSGVFRGWVQGSRSEDPRADIGTYIDLMADLELFIWAAKETGNAQWLQMANRHATESAQHLVRPDGSTYQFGYFEHETGDFVLGETYQGYSDESTWARGQAWAIYGFTLAYKELGNPLFLETAKKTADWFLARLPADKVPYWDFSDPRIPNIFRDSSAAAIAASGLLELAKLRSGTADHDRYRAAAESILTSLAGPSYLDHRAPQRGILRKGALNVPRDVGNSTSLIFGDYYFLEGINRYFE